MKPAFERDFVNGRGTRYTKGEDFVGVKTAHRVFALMRDEAGWTAVYQEKGGAGRLLRVSQDAGPPLKAIQVYRMVKHVLSEEMQEMDEMSSPTLH